MQDNCQVCRWIKEGKRIAHATAYHVILQPDESGRLLIAPKKHYDALDSMPAFERDLFAKAAQFWAGHLKGLTEPPRRNWGHAMLALGTTGPTGFNVKRRIFIVEGTNGCGKDAFLDELRRGMADATEILTHGFYLKLSRVTMRSAEITAYCKDRLDCVLDLMRCHNKDDFILSRFQISTQVYGHVLGNTDIDVSTYEAELNDMNATLILLDVSDKEVLISRLRKRLETSEVPHHDMSPHLKEKDVWDIRKLYIEKYEQSKIENKMYFDTTRQNLPEMRRLLWA